MKHTQYARITGCCLEQLKMLQQAFRENVVPIGSPEALRILSSREYGASIHLLELIKELQLDRILYSRKEPWVNSVLAMIIGRILYQGSKLSLCNQSPDTCLWELCGVSDPPDVEENCYLPMDQLLKRQKAIQKKLAAKHFSEESHLVLYDITSSYLEGEYADSELVDFGYNRDQKKGRKQVVIGLICNAQGCPVGCEIFKGNTNDATTVQGKVQELREEYGLQKVIFVGDRGMLTAPQVEKLQQIDGFNTISALTHGELAKLLKRKVIEPELFDENNIVEIVDPEKENERYCLCRNPLTAQSEIQSRERLIELTKEGLAKIANYKRSTTVEVLGARIGKLMSKYKVEQFFNWKVIRDENGEKSRAHKVSWTLDEEKIQREKELDGCYIVRTDVSREEMDTEQVVAGYKALGEVERAFRNLKTVQLEIRPVYHKGDDRIRAHIFYVC